MHACARMCARRARFFGALIVVAEIYLNLCARYCVIGKCRRYRSAMYPAKAQAIRNVSKSTTRPASGTPARGSKFTSHNLDLQNKSVSPWRETACGARAPWRAQRSWLRCGPVACTKLRLYDCKWS